MEATHPAVKWSLSDRFMFDPDCIFCHSDRCKKVKKAHYWTKEPLSKFEFGGGETVIRTTEAKNKIMIFIYGSKVRTFVLVKTWHAQLDCNVRHTHRTGKSYHFNGLPSYETSKDFAVSAFFCRTFGNRCLSAIGGGNRWSRFAGLVQLSAEAAWPPRSTTIATLCAQ